ncbi:recombinase family protein [Streptomyces prasinus]
MAWSLGNDQSPAPGHSATRSAPVRSARQGRSSSTTTPGCRLVFHVFATFAELIRELIISGTREGLAATRSRDRVRAGRGQSRVVVSRTQGSANRSANTRAK